MTAPRRWGSSPKTVKLDDQTVDWLASIGIEVEFTQEDFPESFCIGVWMDHGKIIVNREVAHVSDVLHECGHLACIPGIFRELVEPGSLLTPKLKAAIEEYCNTHLFMDEMMREDPVWRGIMQMGDCEATAWEYAASKVLGLSVEVLFSERVNGFVPYDGEGPSLWSCMDANSYFGINGLQAAGFCSVREFPTMRRWLAP